jgi:ubiquinone/menaquinone biosynthesis C-methylase UbiE
MSNEWKMDTKKYTDEILSVSVVPDFFRKYLSPNGEKKIGIIACGPALEVKTIDNTFPGYFKDKQTILSDYSSNFIYEALKNTNNLEGNFYFKKADMTSTGMPSESFDLLLCINGLIFENLIPGAVKEAERLLKKGGIYLANTYPPYEQMSGKDFSLLPEFKKFEEKNKLLYIPSDSKNKNAYFEIYNDANKQRQVLINDKIMENFFYSSSLDIISSEKYSLPNDLVSKVREFPLEKIKDDYSYDTTVWKTIKV